MRPTDKTGRRHGPNWARLHVGVAINSPIHAAVGGVSIAVRVVPRSSASGVAGVRDGSLRVRLHAPPVDGAANDELIEVVAKALGVPKRAVSIESGERSRAKRVHVAGVGVDAAEAALLERTV